MAPGTSPTFTESSRLFLYFFGDRFLAVQCTEHYRALWHFHHRWCVPGIPSQWHRQGGKKGSGSLLLPACVSSWVAITNWAVSNLLDPSPCWKNIPGLCDNKQPCVITGIRDPRRWMVLCLFRLHVDKVVPEPTVLINNLCLYWADD